MYILESCEKDGWFVKSVMIGEPMRGVDFTESKRLAALYSSKELAEHDAWFIFETFNHKIEVIEERV